MNYEEFKASLTEQERGIVSAYEKVLGASKHLNVLEIGSGWGIFTRVCIEMKIPNIVTIDKIGGYGLTEFKKNVGELEKYVTRMTGDSKDVLPELKKNTLGYSLIFVDGDHTRPGAHKDLHNAWDLLAPGGTLMIDDVFHRENYSCINHETGEHNFGVGHALWEFMIDKSEIAHAEIFKVGHGLVTIYKP